MKHIPILLATAMMLSATAQAGRDRRDIRLSQAPKAVRSTILANDRGGVVTEVEYHETGARRIFVADVRLPSGGVIEVHVLGNGKLLKTTRDIPLRAAPPAVRDAVSNIGGRVDDVDRETMPDGSIIYQIEIERKGQPDLHLRITPAGRILRRASGDDPLDFDLTHLPVDDRDARA